MNKLTPTPWHWTIHDSSAASIEGPDEMMDYVLTISPCRSCRGQEWEWGRCTTPTAANAAFIVKAVNSHDALVRALEDVVRDVNDYERVNNLAPNPGRTECWDSVARAKAALASIKETSR